MTNQEWSHMVRKRDNNTCAYCGSTERIEAHHIKPKRTHPHLELVIDNGVSLCHECHLRAHDGCFNPKAKPMHERFTAEYCEPVKNFVYNIEKGRVTSHEQNQRETN